MTIKKRLAVSNILMIVVPVLVTMLTTAVCGGLLWMTVFSGQGMGFEDSEDFYTASTQLNYMVAEALESPSEERISALSELTQALDMRTVSLVILEDGEEYYSYGEAVDAKVLSKLEGAAAELEYNGIISAQGYDASVTTETQSGQTYTIFLYSRQTEHSYTDLRTTAAISGLVVMLAVFLSIFLTNRFLTRFVFRRISEPLDMLSAGVREISAGNLECRLDYSNNDEFLPVFESFNDMAARLKESVERTRREEVSRKELMASLSHDLRSPLTSIQAYVEGLLDGVAKTPESRRQYLMTIKVKAEELERLVQRILAYSRMDIEEAPRDAKLMSVDEVLCAEINEVSADYRSRGLNITAELAPFRAVVDPTELRQILLNIADNSLKYKVKGTGELLVRLADGDGEGVLTFTDDGPGVPEEALPMLFELFYRTDPARTDRSKGSGLGLAIVKKAVERMGGTVQAENAPNGGLSVIITIPKGETEDAENIDY